MRATLVPLQEAPDALLARCAAHARSPFQTPAYGASIAAAGGEVTLFALEREGEHLGHALLLEEEQLGFRKWLGLGTPLARSPELWGALVDAGQKARRLAVTWREAPVARIAAGDVAEARAACERAGGQCAVGELATSVVRLDEGFDAVWAAMDRRHRNSARRARALGVFAREEPDALDAFVELSDETFARSGLAGPARGGLARLLAEDWARLFVARDAQGVPVAGAIVTRFGREAVYLHGATRAGSIGASNLLQTEVLRELCAQGASRYDLGGIALPGSPADSPKARGIRAFKEGFGGARETWPSLQLKLDPAGYDAARAAVLARRPG